MLPYWLELLVALVVVAVAQRRLGRSSSATTSTVDRALPSSAVEVRCRIGPPDRGRPDDSGHLVVVDLGSPDPVEPGPAGQAGHGHPHIGRVIQQDGGGVGVLANLLAQLASSPAVQFVLVDGKGGPDYDRLMPRAWLSAKDDLEQVRDVLRRVHRLMVDRQGAIAKVLGVTDAWHLGPSPSWPLVLVVIDEAHTFFHERKGTSPEVKAHNAVVAELSRLVEELVRKGRNVAIQVMLLTQRATGDAIPTRIRDNCQVAISFATRTVDGAVAALGEEIRQHPDASPVLLNDPSYVGVAVTSLPGRAGFHRVRTPQVDHHQVAAIVRATSVRRADPAALLAEQAPGLRVVPNMPAPEGAA